ncbi:MAG: hypothetical protein IV100_20145 [Myxococcales bacterium]|nr:hypothetical protein [Myxococcales bacterium]
MLPATSSTQATAPAGTIAEVLSLSWPIGISMIGHTLMGLVDTLMVAKVSEAAVGAVGLAHAVSLVPFCAGYGLLVGTTPYTSATARPPRGPGSSSTSPGRRPFCGFGGGRGSGCDALSRPHHLPPSPRDGALGDAGRVLDGRPRHSGCGGSTGGGSTGGGS